VIKTKKALYIFGLEFPNAQRAKAAAWKDEFFHSIKIKD
jgi:hypothetical protein